MSQTLVISSVVSFGRTCHTRFASSVTINATPGLKARAQYSAMSLICTATNVYLLVGDLSA